MRGGRGRPLACMAKTAAMKAPRVFLLAYSDMMSPPMPNPSQNRKKHSVAMTDLGLSPNERPDATDARTMSMRTRLRPSRSPSHPKNSWPARVPQKATPLTADWTFGGKTAEELSDERDAEEVVGIGEEAHAGYDDGREVVPLGLGHVERVKDLELFLAHDIDILRLTLQSIWLKMLRENLVIRSCALDLIVCE
ncbi:DNAse I-like superfamily protein [Striga asiatica]|uniref:DNAse I-like superfamily protein n=1 Tax=Striga asiatica TaxID=4170 RepID=A0A5A7QB10_STRAF|nr:DNAse I-like superfamily protein [Striga asiatica]